MIYSGLPALFGNPLASIDIETTGLRADYNEIIQIAIVPLDENLQPHADVKPFYTAVAPKHPERAAPRASQVHGLKVSELAKFAPSSEKVIDLLVEWFQDLDLPAQKRLTPLAHNWEFEHSFLVPWLGQELFNEIFHFHARDGMRLALSINDMAGFAGRKAPFPYVGLPKLCKQLGIVNPNPHDALCDAKAEAELYRYLMTFNVFGQP